MLESTLRLSLLFVAIQAASADTIFQDNFESGGLSAALWASTGSAFVTNDPTSSGNKVLTFAALGSGGDLFGALLPNVAGTYHLEFDFFQPQALIDPNENHLCPRQI